MRFALRSTVSVFTLALTLLAACKSDETLFDPGDGGADGADGGASDVDKPTFAGLKTATAKSESEVALTWDAASDALTPPDRIAYRVYVALSTGGQDFKKSWATTPAGAVSTTISDLLPGTRYFIVVRAVDQSGNEDDNTVEKEVTTADVTAPKFGGVVAVKGVDRDAIAVSWAAAVDKGSAAPTIKYRVYVSDKAGAEDFTKPSAETAPGELSATVKGLDEAKAYYAVVRAVDASGNEDTNLKEKYDSTLDKTPPKFAGVQKATVLGTSVKLLWNDATDNFDKSPDIVYRVYQSKTAGTFDFTKPVATTLPGTTEYSATALDVSTVYSFVVRAVDSSGNAETNVVELSAKTAASADIKPPVFAGLTTATGTSARTIDLTWTSATDDFSTKDGIFYDIYIANSPGAYDFSVPSASTLGGATSFQVKGLLPKQTQYYIVRARDEAGNRESNSIERSATSLADTTPPTIGGAPTVKALGPTSLQVTWPPASDDVTDPKKLVYRVFMSTSTGGQDFSAPIGTVIAGDTSYTVSGLDPAKTYYFVVRAVDEAGNVDSNKNEAKGTTDPDKTPPTFAGISSLTALSPTSVQLNWSPATDDVTTTSGIVYLVYLRGPSGYNFSTPTYTTAAAATSHTVTGLLPKAKVTYVVRARDAAGNIDPNVKELTVSTPADTTAPTFAGISSISAVSATSLTVNFPGATDDVSASNKIVYTICLSTSAATKCNDSDTKWVGAVTVTGLAGAGNYKFTGLTPLTDYYARVWATDEAGNIAKPVTFLTTKTVTDTTPPTFTGCTAAAAAAPPLPGAGASAVDVTWSSATDDVSTAGQISYDIYRAASSGGALTFVTTTSAGATTYRATGLTPSTNYYWVCRAKDQAGNTESNTKYVLGATTADTTPPYLLPGGTAYTGTSGASALSDSAIQINWVAANDNVTAAGSIKYLVCYSTSSTFCTSSFTANGGTFTSTYSRSFTGLPPSTTYYFLVRAQDTAAVNNTTTNVAQSSATTNADATAPTWVGGNPSVTRYNPNANYLYATWSAASDASAVRYQICASTAGYTSYASCVAAGGTTYLTGFGATSFYLGGLARHTNYYVSMRAIDALNNFETGSHWDSAVTATSYASDINPIYVASCNGCHSWSYASTVNVASTCVANYVTPSNPSASKIYQRIIGTTCGTRMPSAAYLSSGQITLFSDWISQGAYNN
ncbi:MAG: fibronectin type III domain-containing protein [Myxococcales bacterium]|nr:fibronectin type III domain-containing protein [Myxococcales bacterium]